MTPIVFLQYTYSSAALKIDFDLLPIYLVSLLILLGIVLICSVHSTTNSLKNEHKMRIGNLIMQFEKYRLQSLNNCFEDDEIQVKQNEVYEKVERLKSQTLGLRLFFQSKFKI